MQVRDGAHATGEGVRWSANRLQAWYLLDGNELEPMTQTDARDLVARLGLPVPPCPAFEAYNDGWSRSPHNSLSGLSASYDSRSPHHSFSGPHPT